MTTHVTGEEVQVNGDVVSVNLILNQKKESEARVFVLGASLSDFVTVLDARSKATWLRGSQAVHLEVGEAGENSVAVNTDDGLIQDGQVLYVFGSKAKLTVKFYK